jgi:sugar phosphate isomerase/epimerase
MLELVNLSNAGFDTENLLRGRGEVLVEFLRQENLAGIELMLCGPWNERLHPARYVRGVHLRFWPDWLDFWQKNQNALLETFCTEAAIEEEYGGNTREAWLEKWRENIRQAVACKAEYVVFHVANVRSSEIYARRFAYTSEEVIKATAQLVNEITADLPETCQLLFENLWWPGLTFCNPHQATILLENISHANTGFMLDTGHLMNTNLQLKTEAEAVEYILSLTGKLGSLQKKIQGMHLHCSLSGQYTKKMMAVKKMKNPLPWNEIMEYILQVDQHQPFRTDAAKRLVQKLQPAYLVHEFIQDSYMDWQEKVRQQRKSLS